MKPILFDCPYCKATMVMHDWPIPNGECVGVECKACQREFVISKECPEDCLSKVKCLGNGLTFVYGNFIE